MNIENLTDADIVWADAVFISSMIVQKQSFEEVVLRCNRLNKPVVAGGPYPTSCHETITGVDHLVIGEAEDIVAPLLQDMQNGHALPVYRCHERPDLAKSVIPRFDLLKMEAYANIPIQYSRGCPFMCEFCDIWPVYGRKPRVKSADHVLVELDTLYRLGWNKYVFIVDDNFIGNKRRVKEELLPALKTWRTKRHHVFQFYTEASINLAEDDDLLAAMRDAGFDEVFVGIESPSSAALEESGKKQNLRVDMEEAIRKIQRYGIGVMAGFILGFDSDGEDIFDEHISFIQRNGIPKAMVGILIALPGTNLHQRLGAEGRLLEETVGNNTHLLTTNFKTAMDPEKLKDGYKRVLSSLYDDNLSNYFARCNTHLDRLEPADQYQHRIRRDQIRTFFASLMRQPFTRYGYQYVKFLLRNFARHRKTFSEAVTLAVMGEHFHTITQEMLKIDVVTTTLEQTYCSLQRQLRHYRQNVYDCSRDSRRQVADLWDQRNRILNDARRKIGAIHADFRGDIIRHYEHVSRQMEELLHQFEADVDKHGHFRQ